MRFRMASSGRRPTAPPMLSSMFLAWLVAGVTTVTAGWLATNLRKPCRGHSIPKDAPPEEGTLKRLARNQVPVGSITEGGPK